MAVQHANVEDAQVSWHPAEELLVSSHVVVVGVALVVALGLAPIVIEARCLAIVTHVDNALQ